LLEPQRTNVNIFSEDITNAAWDKFNVITTDYANVVTSPDGSTNADKLIPNTTSNSYHGIQLSDGRPTLTSGVVYTFSVFAKAQGYDKIRVQNFSQSVRAQFNLTTGTLINQSGTTSTFITPYGNGWYRIGFTYTQSSTLAAYWNTLVISTDDNSGNAPIAWTGNGTDSIAVYGHTIEAGSYPTSYIPTLGSSVTRLADVASKGSISSLVNNSSGTLYFEVLFDKLYDAGGAGPSGIEIGDGGNFANIISIGVVRGAPNIIRATNRSSSSNVFVNAFNVNTVGKYKCAFSYGATGNSFYVNGSLVSNYTTGSSSTAAVVNSFSRLTLGGAFFGGTAISQNNDGILAAALYPVRLSNAELATLTAL
jgi:hypothetical protein